MAKKEHEESIGEMKHADALMERMTQVELVGKVGEPNYLQSLVDSPS